MEDRNDREQLGEPSIEQGGELRRQFIRRWQDLIGERRIEPTAEVDVEQQGRWLVLEGKVPTHGQKARLLDAVPEVDGAAWVIDKLRVSRGVSAYLQPKE
jgi:osmotically-inducible protein OsmY